MSEPLLLPAGQDTTINTSIFADFINTKDICDNIWGDPEQQRIKLELRTSLISKGLTPETKTPREIRSRLGMLEASISAQTREIKKCEEKGKRQEAINALRLRRERNMEQLKLWLELSHLGHEL